MMYLLQSKKATLQIKTLRTIVMAVSMQPINYFLETIWNFQYGFTLMQIGKLFHEEQCSKTDVWCRFLLIFGNYLLYALSVFLLEEEHLTLLLYSCKVDFGEIHILISVNVYQKATKKEDVMSINMIIGITNDFK